jgi:hypothetical protein
MHADGRVVRQPQVWLLHRVGRHEAGFRRRQRSKLHRGESTSRSAAVCARVISFSSACGTASIRSSAAQTRIGLYQVSDWLRSVGERTGCPCADTERRSIQSARSRTRFVRAAGKTFRSARLRRASRSAASRRLTRCRKLALFACQAACISLAENISVRSAWRAACVRLWTPSLSRMPLRCDFTVVSAITKDRAICLFVRPPITSRNT